MVVIFGKGGEHSKSARVSSLGVGKTGEDCVGELHDCSRST